MRSRKAGAGLQGTARHRPGSLCRAPSPCLPSFPRAKPAHASSSTLCSELRRKQAEAEAGAAGATPQQEVDELTATTMCLHYECIKRNKRLLLIYM